ncbi:protein EVI2A [Amia ocellicauda]|uniref:protein EVI2A n=1 Tax=Amia ocellicauda TaxID=2972642 RepID=UPI00346436DF
MESHKINHPLAIAIATILVMQFTGNLCDSNNITVNATATAGTNRVINITSSTPMTESKTESTRATTNPAQKPTPSPCHNLIPKEWEITGLIILGALIIVCTLLLISTTVLACKLCFLTRTGGAPRQPRSNADLLSGQSYWRPVSTDEPGREAGVSETSVMMEEVKAEGSPAEKRAGEGSSATAANGTPAQDEGKPVGADSGTEPESGGARPEEEPGTTASDPPDVADMALVV